MGLKNEGYRIQKKKEIDGGVYLFIFCSTVPNYLHLMNIKKDIYLR